MNPFSIVKILPQYADKLSRATYTVYIGVDKSGIIRYVGITGRDAAIRFSEHLKALGTGRELLRYSVVEGTGQLTKLTARIMEQNIINFHRLINLLNKINSISPQKREQYGIK